MKPSIGRIVLVPMDPATNNGEDTAPAVISRVWNDTCINVRVFGDGPEVEWRTSLVQVDDLAVKPEQHQGNRLWMWPPQVGA